MAAELNDIPPNRRIIDSMRSEEPIRHQVKLNISNLCMGGRRRILDLAYARNQYDSPYCHLI